MAINAMITSNLFRRAIVVLATLSASLTVVEPALAAGRARTGVLVQHEQIVTAGAERGPAVLAGVHAQPDRVLVVADRARQAAVDCRRRLFTGREPDLEAGR